MRRWTATSADPESDPVDEMLERYVDWRERRRGVRDAYEAWDSATAHDRDRAFHAYATALDREQLAAELYQGAVERSAAARRTDRS